MMFNIGNKVVYPSQGPCLIGAEESKIVAGRTIRFYRLTLLDDSGDAVFIPVDKIKALQDAALNGQIGDSETAEPFGKYSHDILKTGSSVRSTT